MDKLIIEGNVPLNGDVVISGAKNAALPIMAAALLTASPCHIDNIPGLRDIDTMINLLKGMGVVITANKNGLTIDANNLSSMEAPYEMVKTMRASVLVLGPLIARWGKAAVSLPGGCAIGARPIDLHLNGLKKMGAKIELKGGYVYASAKRLKGCHLYLDMITVTGTENLMMAATLAKGQTIIENAAKEPEVLDLANMLNSMGAKINGAGTNIITIDGVDELKSTSYAVMPDRIEAATYIAAAAMTKGSVNIIESPLHEMEGILHKFKEAGISINIDKNRLCIAPSPFIINTNIKTLPYPGFPTDMQAQFMAMMCLAKGTSIITESIFENRFMHISELKRMGANIEVRGNTAIVKGVERLSGAPVMATDLRASASLVLAGLAAEGTTSISRIYHLDRGYERMEKKLLGLGARIKRVKV